MESTSEGVITNKNNALDTGTTSRVCKDKLMSYIRPKSIEPSSPQSENVIVNQPYDTCCPNIESLMWNELYHKDEELKSLKVVDMMSKHIELAPCHRSLLLDWLMDVCQSLRVNRETYYLTLEFIDRYMSGSKGVKRTDFHFVGITCLRLASKIEEIDPISSHDLICLSESPYNLKDMDRMELEILKTINWRTTIWTSNKWLFVYLHLVKHVLEPIEFTELTELLDMATLDTNSVQFSNSVLAATCLCLTLPVAICQLKHPTLTLSQISECSKWLEKFRIVVQTKSKKQPDNISSLIPQHYRCRFFKYSTIQRYDNLLETYYRITIANLV